MVRKAKGSSRDLEPLGKPAPGRPRGAACGHNNNKAARFQCLPKLAAYMVCVKAISFAALNESREFRQPGRLDGTIRRFRVRMSAVQHGERGMNGREILSAKAPCFIEPCLPT
jgi:hypothetical protein